MRDARDKLTDEDHATLDLIDRTLAAGGKFPTERQIAGARAFAAAWHMANAALKAKGQRLIPLDVALQVPCDILIGVGTGEIDVLVIEHGNKAAATSETKH